MLNRIALLLILIVAVPYYWLLMDPGPTSVAPCDIDIARLRTLADSQKGPRPVAIEYAAVATNSEPGTYLIAGGGLRSEQTGVFVWRLLTPGGDTIINVGLTKDQAATWGYDNYRPEIQKTAESWLLAARRVIFTSEDLDHIGGLVTLLVEDRSVAKKLIGNPQQLETIKALFPSFTQTITPAPAGLMAPYAYAAIAPGIAIVRTPGFMGGAQMVYVRLQDGREYLFAGDTAPMRRNVEWQRPRSRYAAEWVGREDRRQTLAWIKGLARLKEREPGLKIVYGHDLGWLQDQAEGPRFAAAPPTRLPVREHKSAR
ncbi:hypothetical protein [Novosphingobium sp. AAP93]|uniref:hypothetical protein n=1 Tax=Novosphingobium sp. AAP93 TaxID=1523427 RepID=UPI0006B993B9|nr:hypothetical protein [Novosphingobium sp. AAP93]KPF79401.1 hypothetical protein IP83_16800 [Novosphingobium sp. AAP93]